MDSIIITPKTEQEYSLVMEMLKKMCIKAESVDSHAVRRIPGIAKTYEELTDQLKLVEAEHDPTACIPHDEVVKRLGRRISP